MSNGFNLEAMAEAYVPRIGFELTNIHSVAWLGSLAADETWTGNPAEPIRQRDEIDFIEPGGLTVPAYITGPKREDKDPAAVVLENEQGGNGRLVVQVASDRCEDIDMPIKDTRLLHADQAYFLHNPSDEVLVVRRTITRVQEPELPNYRLHPLHVGVRNGGRLKLKQSYVLPDGLAQRQVRINNTFMNTYSQLLAHRTK